jgi:DNA repair exonuclease SbcCD ATPase subunit
MTREQLKAILPEGADDSAVTKILDALHAEIQPHKDAAKQAADDLAAKVAEMAEISKKAATASEKAKAYEDLQAKYDADIKAANERAAELEFTSKLDDKLKSKGARNLKAAKALLDVDALKASKNQDADIDAAIEALTKGVDTAHEFNPQPTGKKIDIGRATGNSAGGKMTQEQIAKIADRNERHQAIYANMNLFNK